MRKFLLPILLLILSCDPFIKGEPNSWWNIFLIFMFALLCFVVAKLLGIGQKKIETKKSHKEELDKYTTALFKKAQLREEEQDKKDNETCKKERQIVEICKNKLPSFINDNFQINNCPNCNDRYFQLIDVNSDFSGIQLACTTCIKKKWYKINENSKADSSNINIHQELYENLKEVSFVHENDRIINIESNTESNESIQYTKTRRHSIPQDIKDKVWNRDDGKCVQCGSNENLEFDHIIPHSKGGANTYRNIQLLCEPCNRSKSAKIG